MKRFSRRLVVAASAFMMVATLMLAVPSPADASGQKGPVSCHTYSFGTHCQGDMTYTNHCPSRVYVGGTSVLVPRWLWTAGNSAIIIYLQQYLHTAAQAVKDISVWAWLIAINTTFCVRVERHECLIGSTAWGAWCDPYA